MIKIIFLSVFMTLAAVPCLAGSLIDEPLNASPTTADQLVGIDDPSGSWSVNRFTIGDVLGLSNSVPSDTYFTIGSGEGAIRIYHSSTGNDTFFVPYNDGAWDETARIYFDSSADGWRVEGNFAVMDDDLTVFSEDPALGFADYVDDTYYRLLGIDGYLYVQAGAAGAGAVASSGNILFSGYASDNITLFQVRYNDAWNDIWHAGNDGTGTGLDADTVDGYNAGSGPINVIVDNDGITLTGAQLYGGFVVETGNLQTVAIGEDAVAGMNFCVLAYGIDGSAEVWVDPYTGDHVEYDGTPAADGEAIKNSSDTKGDMMCFIAIDESTWIVKYDGNVTIAEETP